MKMRALFAFNVDMSSRQGGRASTEKGSMNATGVEKRMAKENLQHKGIAKPRKTW